MGVAGAGLSQIKTRNYQIAEKAHYYCWNEEIAMCLHQSPMHTKYSINFVFRQRKNTQYRALRYPKNILLQNDYSHHIRDKYKCLRLYFSSLNVMYTKKNFNDLWQIREFHPHFKIESILARICVKCIVFYCSHLSLMPLALYFSTIFRKF